MAKEIKPTPVKENTRSSEAEEASQSRVLRKMGADIEIADEKLSRIQNSINSATGEYEEQMRKNTSSAKKADGLAKEVKRLTSERTKISEKLAKEVKESRKNEEANNKQTQVLEDLTEEITLAKETAIATVVEAEDEAKRIIEDAKTTAKSVKNASIKLEKKTATLSTEIEELETTVVALNDEVKRLEYQETTGKARVLTVDDEVKAKVEALEQLADTEKSEKTIVKDLIAKHKKQEAENKTSDKKRIELERSILKLQKEEEVAQASTKQTISERLATSNRTKHLNKQEAYIKHQFKSAGIPYTPFSQ